LTQRPWRLTQAAEAALTDIARWTYQAFGPRQAEAYAEDLIATCHDIAAGTAQTQDCRRLIAPDLPEDLLFARVGQHFVVLVETAEQVIIIDVLHSRSDLPRRLADLSARRGD
jgi:toxin ParE1/3/4